MKYFAKLNANNHVIDIHNVHDNEAPDEATGIAFLTRIHGHSLWKQYWKDGSGPTKNPAAPDNDYDPTRDAFIQTKPYNSWILNEEDCQWGAPIPYPGGGDGDGKFYKWDEDTLLWVLYEPSTLDRFKL